MTLLIDEYLEKNPEIEWALQDDGNVIFRHTKFDKDDEGVSISAQRLLELTPAALEAILVDGRNVDHITRVTGYFAKTSGWNGGKTGELKDRDRVNLVGGFNNG